MSEQDTESRTRYSAAQQNSEIPGGWKPSRGAPVPVVRCTFIKSDGERCKKWSVRGGTVCIKHGAALPTVREHAEAVTQAARIRLLDNTDIAIDTLEALMEPGTAEGIRLKASTEILDRAGIRGGFEVDVEVTQNENPADVIAQRLMRLRTTALEQRNTVTSEVVDSDTPAQQDALF